ncbi:hypothetical protein ACQ4PT_001361 [Festuca glaucescens]
MEHEPQILRGTRSSCEALHRWECVECKHVNEPKECLLYDLPSFRCNGVRSGIPCAASHLAECIATAIAACLEITERVKRVLKGRSTKRIELADASGLHSQCKDQSMPDFGIYGLQDLVAMALLATTTGVEHVYGGGYYKMSSAGVIDKNDFEQICEALANGYPLVCTFLAGKNLEKLEYCQLYRPPSAEKFKIRNKPIMGHAAVIIGAGRYSGIEHVFFLNSYDRVFCVHLDENGVVRKAGVGKIRACDLLFNNIIFPRENETVGKTSLVAQETTLLSQVNKNAMIPSSSGSLDDVRLGFGGCVTGGDVDCAIGSDRIGADRNASDGGWTGRCYQRDDRGSGGPIRSGGSYRKGPL